MSVTEQQETLAANATGDSRAQLKALTAGSGVYSPGFALISLTGKDRVRWLNGMITNNVRDLAAGNGVYAFVLNAQGQIQGDLYVFNRGESLALEIEREQVEKLLPQLRRYIIMDKVEVEDLSEQVGIIGILGPHASKTLEAIGLNLNDLGPLQIADRSWGEHSIMAIRKDHPLVSSFELWVPKAVLSHIVNALTQNGAVEISDGALEIFRVVSGIPKVGKDIHDRTLPQETGQDRALNFTKGCYIGQEIVERIRARGSVHRVFTGFEISGKAPAPGSKIQSSGKDAGEITTVATIATDDHDKIIALGYLRKEYFAPENELLAGDIRLTVRSLPFANYFEL